MPHLIDVSSLVDPRKDWFQVSIRLENGKSGPDADKQRKVLDSYFGELGVRRIRARFSREIMIELEKRSGFRVLLEAGIEDLPYLDPDIPKKWEQEHLNPWIIPCEDTPERIFEVVQKASLKGWPVMLPPESGILRGDKDFLLAVLEHYLFAPDLLVPIEPFHSLLRSYVQRMDKSDLWRIWMGPPLDYFFIDEEGRVSLSAEWIKMGRLYGLASEPVDVWRSSDPYNELIRKIRAAPEPDSLCSRCNHVRTCRKFFLTMDGKAHCEAWMEVLERIKLAATAILDQRKPVDGRGRRGGGDGKGGGRGRRGGGDGKGDGRGRRGGGDGKGGGRGRRGGGDGKGDGRGRRGGGDGKGDGRGRMGGRRRPLSGSDGNSGGNFGEKKLESGEEPHGDKS